MSSWHVGLGWIVLGLMLFLVGCETLPPTAMPSPSSLPPTPSPSPSPSGPVVSTPVAVQTQPGTFPVAPTGQATPAFFREMPAPGPLPHRGGGTETPLPFPQPGDGSLAEGKAYVTEAWLEWEQSQGKTILHLQGNLPTPCHALRVRIEDREQQPFLVKVYSVYPPEQMCAQVLQPFEVALPLDLPEGSEVLVNGRPVPRR